MKPSCKAIAELLVDFADGELSADEAAPVAGHVADCRSCREKLAALRRSLAAARRVWEQDAATLDEAGVGVSPRRTPRVSRGGPRWRGVAVAAGLLLLVGGGWLWYGRSTSVPAPVPPPTVPASAADVEREIARVGVSAELLGAADMLAAQPGGEEIACERYRYIATAYPGTPAARESEGRLKGFCAERSMP